MRQMTAIFLHFNSTRKEKTAKKQKHFDVEDKTQENF